MQYNSVTLIGHKNPDSEFIDFFWRFKVQVDEYNKPHMVPKMNISINLACRGYEWHPVKQNLIHLSKTCKIWTILTKHGLSYQDLDRTKILVTS